MAEIPNLFEDKERSIQTEAWYFNLLKSPETYKNCVVRSLTHVKNLRSSVVHEYLQVIIERTDTGTRTRIIAERQTNQDQVIIGRWKSVKSSLPFAPALLAFGSNSSSSGKGADLPLPLYSLKFKSDSLKVLDLAKILKNTTIAGGPYNLLKKRHCYWFALTVYDSLKTCFAYIEERWSFARWRGLLIIFKSAADSKAKEFKERRENKMEYTPGEPVSPFNFFKAVYTDAIRLEADNKDSADKTVDNDLTKLIMSDMDNETTFTELKQSDPRSLSVDLDIDAVYDTVQKDRESPKYRKLYDQYKENNPVETVPLPESREELIIPESFVAIAPSHTEVEKINDAIKVMVGYVLTEHQKV